MKKHTGADDPNVVQNSVDSTRRRFLRTSAAASVAALAAPGFLFSQPALAAGRPIRIGFVNPRTGVLAPFGEGEDFVLAGVRKILAAGSSSMELLIL
jgi:branched-chain amino acid transport system substrate-binding protein